MDGFYLLKKENEIIYEGSGWEKVRQVLNSVQPPNSSITDKYMLSAIEIKNGKLNMTYRKYSKHADGKVVNDGGSEIRGIPLEDLGRILERCKQVAE